MLYSYDLLQRYNTIHKYNYSDNLAITTIFFWLPPLSLIWNFVIHFFFDLEKSKNVKNNLCRFLFLTQFFIPLKILTTIMTKIMLLQTHQSSFCKTLLYLNCISGSFKHGSLSSYQTSFLMLTFFIILKVCQNLQAKCLKTIKLDRSKKIKIRINER